MLADRYVDNSKCCDYRGFTLTNEEPLSLRSVIKKLRPKRALSILGGGEQTLFGPVSLGIETLGIDQASQSAYAAMLKGTFLELYGRRVKNILIRGQSYFWDAAREIFPNYDSWDVKYMIETGKAWDFDRFVELWMSVPEAVMDVARENMGLLSLRRDSVQNVTGSFDAAFFSNAMDYGLTAEGIKNILKPGNHAIIASRTWLHPTTGELNQIWSEPSDGWLYWNYHVYRLEPTPECGRRCYVIA